VKRNKVLIMALIASAGVVAWLRHGDKQPNYAKPSVTSIEADDSVYASQVVPAQFRDVPALPISRTMPPAQSTPRAEASEKPRKPAPRGFVQGPLPTSPQLRSAPTTASPKLQQAYQARSSRAAILDRRLEHHIAELDAKLKTANASERTALERERTVLTAQLEARRPWESRDAPRR
jgi:hypothetical protein